MKRITNKPNEKPILAYQDHAIKRWYEGDTALSIANEIQKLYGVVRAESTIRWWFCEEGPLVGALASYADQQNKLRTQQVKNIFIANADKAVGAMARVISGQKGFGLAQGLIADKWLDRAIGKVTERTENVNLNVSFADWVKEQTLNENAERVSEESDPMV